MTSGGKRAGAGRPAKNYKTIAISVPVDVAEKIKQLSQELNLSQGEVVAEMLKNTKLIEPKTMNNQEQMCKCPKCGYVQAVGAWMADANYEYNGKYSSWGGDHTRCPQCNKLIHIDYDLVDVK